MSDDQRLAPSQLRDLPRLGLDAGTPPADDGPTINIPTPACSACPRSEVEAWEFVRLPRLCLMPVRCHGRYQLVVVPTVVIDAARTGPGPRTLPKGWAFKAGEPVYTREQYLLLREALEGVQTEARRYRFSGARLYRVFRSDRATFRAFQSAFSGHGLVLTETPLIDEPLELRWAEDVMGEQMAARLDGNVRAWMLEVGDDDTASD
jgi:hypothetical protein